MNLSPFWKEVFTEAGFSCSHWSEIGKANDPDVKILLWAKENGYTVITHDLDFSALLAATHANFPSVVQLRDMDITPEFQGKFLVETLQLYQMDLESGCLVTIDRSKNRIRLLPL